VLLSPIPLNLRFFALTLHPLHPVAFLPSPNRYIHCWILMVTLRSEQRNIDAQIELFRLVRAILTKHIPQVREKTFLEGLLYNRGVSLTPLSSRLTLFTINIGIVGERIRDSIALA
jgi:hypothetical protein